MTLRLLSQLCILAAWPSVFFASCTQTARTEAALDHIPKTAFADVPLQVWNAPFQGLWVNPNVDLHRESPRKLYIAPVTTDYMTESPRRRWFPEEYAEVMRELSGLFDRELKEKVRLQPSLQSSLVDRRDQAELALEVALVKLDRTLVGVNLLSMGTSFFVPGVSYALGFLSKGDMAMVGRVREVESGRILAVFGDYRQDEPTVFGSLRDYTMYGSHRRTIRMWSDKLAELLAAGGKGHVAPATWMTLNPF